MVASGQDLGDEECVPVGLRVQLGSLIRRILTQHLHRGDAQRRNREAPSRTFARELAQHAAQWMMRADFVIPVGANCH
ncbi:MAG: hypothetical protein LC739_05330 [Actinobacteria bacterium]|nr:hypothetical protein [Actinomycetota bacterium]